MSSKKVAIYGAGFLGKVLFKNLSFLDYKVSYFVDEFFPKEELFKVPVYRLREVKEKEIPIYIAVEKDKSSIFEKLKNNGFKEVHFWNELFNEKFEPLLSKNQPSFSLLKKILKETSFTLVINHQLGGGSTEYLKNLISKNQEKSFLVVELLPFYFTPKELLEVTLYSKNEVKTFLFHGLENFFLFLREVKVREILLNHLITYPLWVTDLLKAFFGDKEVTFMVHDFFSLCPRYNLIDFKGECCFLVKEETYCDECLKRLEFFEKFLFEKYGNLSISTWRKRFTEFFEGVSQIICFSKTSKELLLKVFPWALKKVAVVPHEVNWVCKVNPKKSKEALNIAVIGNITYPKGERVVVKLAKYLKIKNEQIRIHLFGRLFTEKPEDLSPVLTFHGVYEKTELPMLLENSGIELVLIPSIWPETFCYTAEEVMKMELPLAVFNIGAQYERALNYEKSLILDYAKKYEPDYIVKEIKEFLKK